jgi:hypothetical protein
MKYSNYWWPAHFWILEIPSEISSHSQLKAFWNMSEMFDWAKENSTRVNLISRNMWIPAMFLKCQKIPSHGARQFFFFTPCRFRPESKSTWGWWSTTPHCWPCRLQDRTSSHRLCCTNFVTLDFLVFASSVSRVSIIRACTDHTQELRDCHFQLWSEQKLDQLFCGSI